MEDQLNEVLETVRFLKENVVTKADLLESEGRLEKKIIFGVAEFMEHNILPQLDAMGKDIHLIKTALNGNIARY